MAYRKLRIAWSVGWGSLAVLLLVLWVRSYWQADELGGDVGHGFTSIGIRAGKLVFLRLRFQTGLPIGIHTFPRLVYDPTTVSYSDRIVEEQTHHPFGFWWEAAPDSLEIALPLWFSTLLFTCLSVAPWIRWRFSLRTLLIATTLVAIGLGLVVWMVR
jgi:hypothetical protein